MLVETNVRNLPIIPAPLATPTTDQLFPAVDDLYDLTYIINVVNV